VGSLLSGMPLNLGWTTCLWIAYIRNNRVSCLFEVIHILQLMSSILLIHIRWIQLPSCIVCSRLHLSACWMSSPPCNHCRRLRCFTWSMVSMDRKWHDEWRRTQRHHHVRVLPKDTLSSPLLEYIAYTIGSTCSGLVDDVRRIHSTAAVPCIVACCKESDAR
jgi:hypothetical protein